MADDLLCRFVFVCRSNPEFLERNSRCVTYNGSNVLALIARSKVQSRFEYHGNRARCMIRCQPTFSDLAASTVAIVPRCWAVWVMQTDDAVYEPNLCWG